MTREELLSREAWELLCNFSSERAKTSFKARLELEQHRLGGKARSLLRYAQLYPSIEYELTDYAITYRMTFAGLYQAKEL